jgi:hypothetical protein
MPTASRAHGERICLADVLGARRFFAAGLRDARGRRFGEVFVATYTSMMTGRITGLRWVTS